MKLRLFAPTLVALALTAVAHAQSLPAPNLGCAFKINGTAVGCPAGVPVGGTGVATLSGIVKANGALPFSAAVAGTDYLAPNGNGSGLIGLIASQIGSVPAGLLKGSSGAFVAAVAADVASAAAGSATPIVDAGAGSAGSSNLYARADHAHPTDTSRAAASRTIGTSGSLTGGGDLSADRTLAYSGDGAWTTFSPTVSWGTAAPTISSSSFAWRRSGTKTIDVRVSITISGTGACTAFACGLMFFTIPNSFSTSVNQACVFEDLAANIYWGVAATTTLQFAPPGGGAWGAREYIGKCSSIEVN